MREFYRAYRQYRALNRVLADARSQQVSQLYILLIHPLAHLLYKLFSSKSVPVFIVMHGELESLKFNKHFLNKIWGWILSKALKTDNRATTYIILGRSIYANLVRVVPAFSAQKAIVLDHPYPFHPHPEKRPEAGRTVFSSLGVATLAKNSQYFFAVAGAAATQGLLEKSAFYVCGRVYKNMEPYLNDAVHYKKGFASLDRSEIGEMLQKTDYAVFYYDNVHYSLCSSGAFWDAIDAEIPLLYVKNDYFNYYSTLVGEIGISFETPEQLNDFILKALNENNLVTARYTHFVKNIRTLKYQHMTKENIKNQLMQTIN